MKKTKIKVGIIGANGYAGMEVLRLISSHPHAEINAVTSRAQLGKKVCEAFPALSCNLTFTEPDSSDIYACDVVFVALPQTAGAEICGNLIDRGIRVIDLSADYRFDDISVYEKTYGVTHPRPDLNKKAVYGLCEVNREKIRNAALISNPGCYVTSAVLPLIPLCKNKLVDNIIIDSKSGVSGAGRKSDEAYSFTTLHENFKAYGVFTHRHAPEIEEKIGHKIIFTPHLLPIKRGILSTVYFTVRDKDTALSALKHAYEGETFVRYSDSLPEISHVVCTNKCVFSARFDDAGHGIIVSVIDNLLKGAAGQAVQNMNIMFGFDETSGLPVDAPI